MKDNDILHLASLTNNKLVKEALLKVCTKNTKLTTFINNVFKRYKDHEIYAFEDYGWEWDIECDEVTEIAMCNHDFRDEKHYDGDGWLFHHCPEMFSMYFMNFNWGDIKLDNGKLLLLIDFDDYLAFQIVDEDKMMDGKLEHYGISW